MKQQAKRCPEPEIRDDFLGLAEDWRRLAIHAFWQDEYRLTGVISLPAFPVSEGYDTQSLREPPPRVVPDA